MTKWKFHILYVGIWIVNVHMHVHVLLPSQAFINIISEQLLLLPFSYGPQEVEVDRERNPNK